MTKILEAFDAAVAHGERSAIAVYRGQGSERPPRRVLDGLFATGSAKALELKLLFRITHLYNVLDTWGDKHARYCAFTENNVYTRAMRVLRQQSRGLAKIAHPVDISQVFCLRCPVAVS